jgi:hypothetical protein
MSKASTALQLLRKQGATGVLDRLGDYVRPYLVLDESHVWYCQDLTGPLPLPQVPPGLRVRQGDLADLDLLQRLPTIGTQEAGRRLAAGGSLWLVLDGDEPLFACWLFRGSAPAVAAAGGAFKLPSDIVMLEDSVTAEAARGRGIGPLAWSTLALTEQAAGSKMIITKIAVDNVPSRKAVIKVGFRPLAIVRFHRVGGRGGRTELFPIEDSDGAAWLAEALSATHPFLNGRNGRVL